MPARTQGCFLNPSPHWVRAKAQLAVYRRDPSRLQTICCSPFPTHCTGSHQSPGPPPHKEGCQKPGNTKEPCSRRIPINRKQDLFLLSVCLCSKEHFYLCLKTSLCCLYGQLQIFLNRAEMFVSAGYFTIAHVFPAMLDGLHHHSSPSCQDRWTPPLLKPFLPRQMDPQT